MKQHNEKYRVIPGLSLKGKDIRQRLINGTLKPQQSRFQQDIDEAMQAFEKLDRPGRMAEIMNNGKKIANLKDTLKPKQ